MKARASYVNACTGLSLEGPEVANLLNRMSLFAKTTVNTDELLVEIPPTRPDILHECDIMEDAAIAYGFNKLPKTFPRTSTVAQPLAVSKLSDMIRAECAYAGWVEVLPLILVRINSTYIIPANFRTTISSNLRLTVFVPFQCSHDENFAWLNRKDDGTTAVKLANPKTAEYQVVRTTLIPGLLKTIRENKAHSLPIRIFETSDVVTKDPSSERQARNTRHLAAIWCNKTAGFEVVHGLLDRVMAMLEIPRLLAGDPKAAHGYYIRETDGKQWKSPAKGLVLGAVNLTRSAFGWRPDATFFPGRGAKIYYRPAPGTLPSVGKPRVAAKAGAEKTSGSSSSSANDIDIGILGILHPSVLANFEIPYPCSALELELDLFKKEVVAVWEDEPTPDVPGG